MAKQVKPDYLRAAFVVASAALAVSEGRPEDAYALIGQYRELIEPVAVGLAILAGRGVRPGEDMTEVLDALETGIGNLQARMAA